MDPAKWAGNAVDAAKAGSPNWRRFIRAEVSPTTIGSLREHGGARKRAAAIEADHTVATETG